MTNRVHIDAPAGIVEIEGEKEFVEGLLAKLFPLLENAGFGTRPSRKAAADQDQVDMDEGHEDDPAEIRPDEAKTKMRRKRGVTPKGHSCADRMLILKEEEFFKIKRGGADIVAGLASKGFTHKSNQVAAAGESLFKRGLLQRTKDGNGPFQYFWDRG